MKLARREFLGAAAGAAALAGGAGSAPAALYPERPIRLILPFPPGGVFDIIGRPWAGKVAFGSAGTGTLNHLSGELLKSLTGITDLPHVPYRGAGPAMADAIGGQIPIIIPAMTSQVLEFHR